MKKLLLLLLPFISFAQDFYLDHSVINEPPIIVGDTISIKFNTVDNNQSSFTFLQFDYQYNNKLLQKIDHTFYGGGAQTSLNHWDGYSFNPNQNESLNNLTAQFNWWAGGNASYGISQDWSVERITLQHSSAIPHGEQFIIVRFLVKDKANTSYSDYNNVTRLSWARSSNNSNGISYIVNALTQSISLNQVKGGGAGDVILKLNTQSEHPEDYLYSIIKNGNLITSGYFDANNEAIVTTLENDIEYEIYVSVDEQAASWLGDVVSITDAYMVFLSAINSGENPSNSGNNTVDEIKKALFDVTADGIIDFDDSYALLTHVAGETLANTYITKEGTAYNITTTDKPILPTETEKIFNIYHYLSGDADFSHSYYEAKAAASMFSLETKNIVQHDLELTTQLANGKVEFIVNLDRSDISAIEFIINYDETKLEFDKIIFNSGDNITNYSTKKEGAVYFGSIDPQAKLQIKTGQSYKIVFNPKVQVTNTAGLIYFKRQEAVTTQGQKINLNLK